MYRPAATYFATTDIAGVAPGLSAHDFCRALPERCGVVAIPSSVFYGAGQPAVAGSENAGRTLVRWAFCKRDEVLHEALRRLDIVDPVDMTVDHLGRCLHRPRLHRQPGRGVPPEHRGRRRGSAHVRGPHAVPRLRAGDLRDGVRHSGGRPGGEGGGTTPDTFALRWFSPSVEIDLCGHATLASAHVLRQRGVVDGTAPVTFHTRSGPLVAAFEGDRIDLDFPTAPMTRGAAARRPGRGVGRRRRRGDRHHRFLLRRGPVQ